jgi:aminoglycoside 6'-N-acetyltransferase I
LLERAEGGSTAEGLSLQVIRDIVKVGLRKYTEGSDISPVAYLEGIWIDSDLHRIGATSDLVQEAEGWALASGIEELAFDCQIDNCVSEAFHRAATFIEARWNIFWRRDVPPGSG